MMLLQCLDSADVCDVKGLSFICYHLVSCQKRQKPFIAEKVDATILLFKRISWKHPYLNIIQVKINTLYKCIISMFPLFYCSDINLYIYAYLNSTSVLCWRKVFSFLKISFDWMCNQVDMTYMFMHTLL